MLLPALMMSIGWALRGSIGGGPLGAMIPGALWAMAIAYQKKWTARQASLFIGLCTIGIGLGGQMTYGQTIGLFRDPDTRLWGLIGLTVKGAIWGLLGGVLISLAWLMPKRPVRVSLFLMVATQAGWMLINQPKLIYFSNRLIRPREEIWAGLALSALAVLLLVRNPIAYRFALWGTLGGAIGFGGGTFFNLVPIQNFPGWKMMEFTFGLILGALLQRAVPDTAPIEAKPWKSWHQVSYPLLALLTVGVDLTLQVRFAFTAVTSILILILAMAPQLGWTIGLSVTLAAACWELYPTHPNWAIALALIPPGILAWWQSTVEIFNLKAMLLLLLTCCWIYCLEYFPILR